MEAKAIIKGDISNLENELKKANQLIDSTYKDINSNQERQISLEKKLQHSSEAQIRILKSLEQTKKSLSKQFIDGTNLTEEEYKENKRLEAEYRKTEDTIKRVNSAYATRNKLLNTELRSVKQNIAANKTLISQQQSVVSRTEKLTAVQNEATKSTDKQKKSTESLANATIRYLRWAGTIAGVVYAANRAWRTTLGTGIEVNKIIESNTMGIAALTSANTRMVDSLGNTLTPFEKFAMGQKVATKAVEDLRVASVKTYATFPQLLEIYQQAIGQTMSMGGAFGQTVDEVSRNTIELSKTLSNIAGSIGMPMDRVREEIRSMLSGNASTDSLISTMLFGSPSEANKAIRDAKGKTNGVVDMLNDMMKDFKILETTKTYQKGILTLQDAWSRAMGDMVQKSGMFQDITNMFYKMSEDIVNNTDNLIDTFDSLYNSIKILEVPFDSLTSVGGVLVDIMSELLEATEDLQDTISGDNALDLFSSSMLGLSVILDTVYVGLHNSITILSKLKPTGNIFTDILQATKIDLKELNKEIISFDNFENRLIKTYERISNIQKEGQTRTAGVSVARITSKIDTSSLNKEDLKTIYDSLLEIYKDHEDKKLALAKWYKEERYKIDPNLEYEELLNKKFKSDKDYYEALEKLNAKTRINIANQTGEKQASLLLKLGIDEKQLEEMRKSIETGEDKIVKLQKKKLEYQKQLKKYQEEYDKNVKANTLDKETEKTLTEAIAIATKAINSEQAKITEETEKRAKKLNQFKIEDFVNASMFDQTRTYTEWLNIANQKMIDLAETGKLTAQELQKVWDVMSKDAPEIKDKDEKKPSSKKRDIKLDLDLQKQQIELTMIGIEKEKELARIQHEKNIAAIKDRAIRGEESAEYYAKLIEFENERARQEQFNFTLTGQIIQTTSQQMESSLGDFLDFASDGFLDFGDLAMDVLNQIWKKILQMQVIEPLVSSGTQLAMSYFNPVSALPSLGSMGISAIPNTVTPLAKGGAISSPSLSQYSNQVVSKPTPFFFASGGVPGSNMGVFGEAGAEAIMPLTRTSSGDLGVKAVNSNQNVTVKIINESGQEMKATSADTQFDMDGMVLTIVMDAANTNKMGFRDAMGAIR